MRVATDMFTVVAVIAGAFFFMAGTVGLLRFPDALTRLHALTKADNLGLGLIVLGLLPRAGGPLDALKLVAIWLLVQLAGGNGCPAHCARGAAQWAAGMTIDFALDGGLAALVAAVAGWTIVARASFAAVVGFVAFGLLATLAWVRLDAIDVAMTEAAIGSGLTGAMLLNAAARLRASEVRIEAERPGTVLRVVAALLSTSVAAALAAAVLLLPDPAPTLAPAAAANAAATGLGNPVTNVLIAFRAMDTLLEKVVLLLALIGVWSLAPDRFWGGRPAPLRQADPGGALTLLARLLPAVGHRRRHLHPLGGRRSSRRCVPGWHDPRRDVALGIDGRA